MIRPSVGSLFSGIGGIDLGLERAGFRVAWMCERDAYCQRVLAHHWPGVPIYDDATNLPDDVERVDVITAGFPCQPVSYAGQRKAQDDERWLWPYVQDCISVLRPRGVLLENVPGLLTAGFDDVIGGLAARGYDAEWDCIPAAALGAPHLRDRIFVIATPCDAATDSAHGRWDDPMAHADEYRLYGTVGAEMAPAQSGRRRPYAEAGGPSGGRQGAAVPHSTSTGPQGHRGHEQANPCHFTARGASNAKGAYTTPNGKGKADKPIHDRFRAEWPPEPNVGRVADGVPNRVDRLRALGNAVVPQVAEYVGNQLARMMGVRDA